MYDALRAAILSGQLRAGARLPATRALAAELALARTTVLTAAGADVTMVPVEAGHNLLGSHDKETHEAVLLRFFHKHLYGTCVV